MRSDALDRTTVDTDELVASLVADFARPIYRMALSIVRDHALAEDVAQETLIRAWQAYDSFRGDSPLGAWVLKIGHNVAVSTLRRLRDTPTDPTLLPDAPVTGPEGLVADRLAVERVWAALDKIDPLSRTIVVLREIEGLSYEEIAEITDVSLSLVKTRLFRTRRLLADSLKEWR